MKIVLFGMTNPFEEFFIGEYLGDEVFCYTLIPPSFEVYHKISPSELDGNTIILNKDLGDALMEDLLIKYDEDIDLYRIGLYDKIRYNQDFIKFIESNKRDFPNLVIEELPKGTPYRISPYGPNFSEVIDLLRKEEWFVLNKNKIESIFKS